MRDPKVDLCLDACPEEMRPLAAHFADVHLVGAAAIHEGNWIDRRQCLRICTNMLPTMR
jgi:hypothetical protein